MCFVNWDVPKNRDDSTFKISFIGFFGSFRISIKDTMNIEFFFGWVAHQRKLFKWVSRYIYWFFAGYENIVLCPQLFLRGLPIANTFCIHWINMNLTPYGRASYSNPIVLWLLLQEAGAPQE